MDAYKPSSALIAAERAALEQRLHRFIDDEMGDFSRKYGVTVTSIKADVYQYTGGPRSSFVASVHVGITET